MKRSLSLLYLNATGVWSLLTWFKTMWWMSKCISALIHVSDARYSIVNQHVRRRFSLKCHLSVLFQERSWASHLTTRTSIMFLWVKARRSLLNKPSLWQLRKAIGSYYRYSNPTLMLYTLYTKKNTFYEVWESHHKFTMYREHPQPYFVFTESSNNHVEKMQL